MTTHDHLRLVFMKRLAGMDGSGCAHLLGIESDEELAEMRRVGLVEGGILSGMGMMVERIDRETRRRLDHSIPLYGESPVETMKATPSLDAIALELAKQMAGQKDELIRKVAKARVGEIGDIELAKRMRCSLPMNRDEGHLWFLDGQPLVMIWLPTVESIADGGSNRMKATFQYRIYP